MTSMVAKTGAFTLRAYRGDAKTLLAFNLTKAATKGLAGFTIQCLPKGKTPYFLFNNLRFEKPASHAQDLNEPANSSINAPIHKFRWLHVPGSFHQGTKPFFGDYTYTATPRFFEAGGKLAPLDSTLSASLTIKVDGFTKGSLGLGFTRGYTQSQAFVHHFGRKALIRPKGKDLLFDTTKVSGANDLGEKYTFAEEYDWLGFTARERAFGLLNDVLDDKSLSVDVFAYDLNEPDLIGILLKLAKQGRIRVILDNAALHHSKTDPKAEDEFEGLFTTAAGNRELLKRGKFGRYAHDKVFVVSKTTGTKTKAIKVLTGSTNFSVTGVYVNSNHILIYNDPKVAGWYAGVFEDSWASGVSKSAFLKTDWAAKLFSSTASKTPVTEITFSPHNETNAIDLLQKIVARIEKEGKKSGKGKSVLFAVMQIDKGTSPVYDALNTLHESQEVFSYGISDSPKGIKLYPVGKKTGVLVTGKPVSTQLPPPFDQVPNLGGVGHQIHHKFVVCGFNGDDPVVFCGSSNLAVGGEMENGDNLITIRDGDVATVFAIEALSLVDHFDFLDRSSASPTAKKKASKLEAAEAAGWFLSTTDKWAAKYFDPDDLHSVDRELFA